MTLLCVAPHCRLPRQHTTDCSGLDDNGERCRGCLPALAVVGALCEHCFTATRTLLAEVGELHARLAEGPPDVVDLRLIGFHAPGCRRDRPQPCLGCAPGTGPYRDPVAARVTSGPVTTTGAPRVSGTPAASVPANLDTVDLLGPVRPATVSATRSYAPATYWTGAAPGRAPTCRCGWPAIPVDGHPRVADVQAGHGWDHWHDQTGHPSVATTLDLWARDWSEHGAGKPPVPTVAELVRWLLARLEWAATHHPAIREFIDETRSLRGRLQTVLRERDPDPEHLPAVPCKTDSCDRWDLWRRPDGSGTVDCHSCGRVYLATEYEAWTRLAAAFAKRVHADVAERVRALHADNGGVCDTCHQPAKVDRVALTSDPTTARVLLDCHHETYVDVR